MTGETSAQPLADAGITEPEEALMELADVSLVHMADDQAEVHRLVQEITRGRIAADQRPKRARAALDVINWFTGLRSRRGVVHGYSSSLIGSQSSSRNIGLPVWSGRVVERSMPRAR